MVSFVIVIYFIGCIATLDVARRDMLYGHSLGIIKNDWTVVVHALCSAICTFIWPLTLPLYILIVKPFGKLE